MDDRILALDIGGANIKSACNDGWTCSDAFAVWQNREGLSEALLHVIEKSEQGKKKINTILVTMTAELCDCYESKEQGVNHVLDCLTKAADDREIWVYLTGGMFVRVDQAKQRYLLAGASNWDALGRCAGQIYHQGRVLVMDMGSTTTDLILLKEGKVLTQGRNDLERLKYGELVYVGCRRTALMALGGQVEIESPDQKQQIVFNVMAEHFADMDDVLILLGIKKPSADDFTSADGRARDVQGAWGRVVRMIGGDRQMVDLKMAKKIALGFLELLGQRLMDNLEKILDLKNSKPVDEIVLSGEGSTLLGDLLAEVFAGIKISKIADRIGNPATISSCGVSLITLFEMEQSNDKT